MLERHKVRSGSKQCGFLKSHPQPQNMLKYLIPGALILLSAACTAAPVGNRDAAATRVVVTLPADPLVALTQAIDASHSTFPLRLTVEDAENKIVVEYATKSRSRISVAVKAGTAEFLAIEADLYSKIGSAAWAQDVKGNLAETMKQNPAGSFHNPEDLILQLRNSNISSKGPEMRGEQRVQRYEATHKAGDRMILDIDTSNGKLYSMDAVGGEFNGKWRWEFPSTIKTIEAPTIKW